MDSRAQPDSIEQTARRVAQARRTLAYDHLDSILERPLLWEEDRVFPRFAAEASGWRLRDTTGQVFVDWVNAGGPVILGHRRAEVDEAIRRQLEAGITFSMMHPLEIEVAASLVEMIPCAERVAFGKNGSDALAAATRLARAVTGRERILHYGMHGFHDWFVAGNAAVRGAPSALRPLVQPFDYNDLESLGRLLERDASNVAAVVMEPVREQLPRPGYLEGVRELTRRHGALLVFDEVVTAFRLGNGGAQELYGVLPDLVCLGKSMGNGMPISAIAGPREWMTRLPAVAFGMTFSLETLTLSAARAVLGILREEPVAERLAETGRRVREAFDALCRRHGVPASLAGPPARMTFVFHETPVMPAAAVQKLFVQECLKRGVFTNGNILPSAAHDDEAIERTARGFDGALAAVAEALGAPRAEPGEPPIGPRARIARGYLEDVRRRDGRIELSGWALLDGWAADRVEIATGDGAAIAAEVVIRPDVARAYPDHARAERAGFRVALRAGSAADSAPLRLMIRLLRRDRVDFLCRLVLESAPDESGAWPGPHWIGDGTLCL